MSSTVPSWSTARRGNAVAADAEEHLIEMPFCPRVAAAVGAAPIREAPGANSRRRAPDRLVGEDDAALGQEQLDVPEAQRERVVEPEPRGR